jgi:DNA-binding NarL/FixJ family response regulator
MPALPATIASSRLTRVLLADEAGFSRIALTGLLHDTPGVELVGVEADPRSLRSAFARLGPDVLIVDDRLLQQLDWLAGDMGVRVIVIGVDDDPAYTARAARLGAITWLPKERADLLLEALLEQSTAAGMYGPGPRPIADDGRRSAA